MKCVGCTQGETATGVTTITLERDSLTLVVREVPAEVCANCGEAYVADDVAAELGEMGVRAVATNARFEVRQYEPAPVLA